MQENQPQTLSQLFESATKKYQGSEERKSLLFVRENLTEESYLNQLANNYANFPVFKRLGLALNLSEVLPSSEHELITVETWRNIITMMETAAQDTTPLENMDEAELTALENDL